MPLRKYIAESACNIPQIIYNLQIPRMDFPTAATEEKQIMENLQIIIKSLKAIREEVNLVAALPVHGYSVVISSGDFEVRFFSDRADIFNVRHQIKFSLYGEAAKDFEQKVDEGYDVSKLCEDAQFTVCQRMESRK